MMSKARRRFRRQIADIINVKEVERLRQLIQRYAEEDGARQRLWGNANSRCALFVAEASAMCDDFDAYVAMTNAGLKAVQKVVGKESLTYAWCEAARMYKIMLRSKK